MNGKRHDGSHGEECFGCRIQSVQLSPSAMPTRRNSNPPRVVNHNSWENGVKTDARGMPILTADLKPIGLKQWTENRHRYEGLLRQNQNAPIAQE